MLDSRPNRSNQGPDATMPVALDELHEVTTAGLFTPLAPELVACERYDVRLAPHSESNFYIGFEPRVGIFVATHRPLPLGVTVSIRIRMPRDMCLVSEGYVHWIRDTAHCGFPPGMGVRLDTLTPSQEQVVNRYMAQREALFFPER